MKDLARWRRSIDRTDRKLVRLLNARAEAVLAIGRWKRVHGVPVYDPRREAQIASKVQSLNKGPLDDTTIKRLFERIIDEFRAFERAHQDDPQARRRRRRAAGGPRGAAGAVGGLIPAPRSQAP